MPSLIQINEVTIISIDKNEESWEVEGEILFEEDLSCSFAVTYLSEDDELDGLQFEIDTNSIGNFDRAQLKEMIIEAANEFDED